MLWAGEAMSDQRPGDRAAFEPLALGRRQQRQHVGDERAHVGVGVGEALVVLAGRHPERAVRPAAAYFAVGITNSAPLAVLSGQRCMTDFCLV